MKLKSLPILLLGLEISFAQVDTVWTRRYDGSDYNDIACGLAIDSNGNIYITGTTYIWEPPVLGDGDYATIKYNQSGDSIWVNHYNGPWGTDDGAIGIIVDASDNVYVCGYSMGMDATYDYATIKYNSDGNTVWVRHLNGPWGDHDYPAAFTVDDSGNVYVTGLTNGAWTYEDYLTVKYNASGDTIWIRAYNHHIADRYDAASSIAFDRDGNVYVTGKSWDYVTRYDYATIKYDANGNEIWVVRYNGTLDSTDTAVGIAVDDSGYIYVTGSSMLSGSGSDIVTIKYNAGGDTVWTRCYNGSGDDTDSPTAILTDDMGNIYVIGYSTEANRDYCTIKYDKDGNELWAAHYNGAGNGIDRAYALTLDDSCNVYITGASYGSAPNDDCATVKYDSYGNEIWAIRYNGIANGHDRAYAIAVDSAGYVYVTGESFGGSGAYSDYVTIKYSQSTGIAEESTVGYASVMAVRSSIFRNEAEIEYTLVKPDKVSLQIYDIQGRLVKTLVNNKWQNGNYRVRWESKDDHGRQSPAGVYLVRLITSNNSITRKIVKIK